MPDPLHDALTTQPATSGLVDDRTPMQRHAEASLAPHLYRLELRGRPRQLTWPSICANCGAPSTERLRVKKGFFHHRLYGSSRTTSYGYKVVTADIPFCGACLELHRQTRQPSGFWKRYGWVVLNPAHIATIGLILLFFKFLLPLAMERYSDPRAQLGAWALAAVGPLGIAWIFFITWWQTRPERFWRSEVSRSCDISENIGIGFAGGHRHIYALRNQQFAEALRAANHDRVWTADDQARHRRNAGWGALIFIVVLIIARLLMKYYTGK